MKTLLKLYFSCMAIAVFWQSNGQCHVQKVYINAYLANPVSGGLDSFDTDQNGSASITSDEFIQLCNDSIGDVVLTGFELSDIVGVKYTFGADTISAGECLTIINNWSGVGLIPGYFRSINTGAAIWNNGGDDIILSDGIDTCTVTYSGTVSDNKPGCVSVVGNMSTSGVVDCSLDPSSLGSSSLPVLWLYVKGLVINGTTRIEWATASEFNNDYFEVQKSIDGRNFRSIGRILGRGNSNAVKKYNYTDDIRADANYYRIKQVDYNGVSTYSIIVVPGLELNRSYFTNQKELVVVNSLEDVSQYKVLNTRGVVVKEGEFRERLVLEKRNYSCGIYYVYVQGNRNSRVIKWLCLQ